MSVRLDQPGVADSTDRRSVRSRQALMDALGELLKRKELGEVSIQEIADEADLTRATFYLHYPDKWALLQAMTAARFRELLAKRGIGALTCARGVRDVALGVCDYLAGASGCPSGLRKLPLERSLIPVIEQIFREGGDERLLRSGLSADVFAATIAWAIFGAASRWAQTPGRRPAEEMAEMIESLVKPLMQSATAV